MRYSKALVRYADEYRRTELNSTDDLDQTIMTDDWTKMEVSNSVLTAHCYSGRA